MKRIMPLKEGKASFPGSSALEEAYGVSRIVSIAAQHGAYKATCLRRSLLVWWILREEGIASEICLGVRILNRKLEAHAWVEIEGIVVSDSGDIREQYQILEDGLPSTNFGL